MTDDASRRVRLRPFTEADIDIVEADLLSIDGTGAYQWFGYTSASGVRRNYSQNGLLDSDGGVLAVEIDGEQFAGRVEWFESAWGRNETSWCWTIAIGIREELRGRGIGTQAQRLLVTYLFAHTRAQRIQAYTDIENIAEQRALEKVGFAREGILRSAQWRDGTWHDMALYAIVRDDLD